MKHVLVMLIAAIVIAVTGKGDAEQRAMPRDHPSAGSRVYELDELTWPRIDAFERRRTLFILPSGMVEQHGPHLPVGADTIGVTQEATAVARRVSLEMPDWNVVLLPAINYGHAGANLLGDMPIHPGTYGIRQSTLRALVADVGAQLAQNGFTWVFVLSGHGSPTHNIAINEACDFVSETFGVTMLNVTGLFGGDASIQARGVRVNARHFRPDQLSAFGMDVHAGVGETSQMLAIRPDLVAPIYKSLVSQAGHSIEELRQVASKPGWQGYLSAPSRATAAHGRSLKEWWIGGFTELIVRAVRGENMFAHPRVPASVPPAVAPVLGKLLADETAFGITLDTWLARHGRR